MAFCAQCGSQNLDGARFCAACGNPLPETQTGAAEQPAAPQAPPPGPPVYASPAPPPPSGRGRGVGFAALIATVLLIGAGVAAYFLFFALSPKDLFLHANAQYFSASVLSADSELGTYFQLQQRLTTEPVETSTKLSGSVASGDADPTIGMVQRYLDRSSLVVLSKTDPQAKQSLRELKVNLRGSELASGEVYISPDQVAVKAPFLLDKYLMVENRDLKATAARLGIAYNGPDQLLTSADVESTVRWEQLKPVLADYGKYLVDSINESEVTSESGIEFPTRSGSIKVRRLTLSLSEARLKEILKGTSTRLRGDEKALDLFAQVAGDFGKIMNQGGTMPPEIKQWQDKAWVKEQIRTGSRDWEKSLDEVLFPEGVKVVLLLDGRKLVSETILMAVAPADTPKEIARLEVAFTDWTEGDVTERTLRGRAVLEETESLLEIHSTTTRESKTQSTNDLSVSIRHTEQGSVLNKIGGELTTVITKNAGSGKDKVDREFTLMSDDGWSTTKLSGKLNSLQSNQVKGSRYEATHDLTFTAGHDSMASDITVGIKVETSIDFKKGSFPTFSDSNAVNLSKASQRELEQLLSEMGSAFERFMERNAALFF